uniref:RING-type domain-containing protein n=1 Tax=Glossina brevipalpis TaxID=37001 RepID=A0A1A9W0Q8_9MUSC
MALIGSLLLHLKCLQFSKTQQLIDEVRQDLNCLINKRQDLEEMRSSWDSESQGSWDSAFQQSIYEVRQYLNYFNRQQVLEEARSRLNQLSGDDRMIMVNVFIPSEEFNIETSNGDQLSCAICIDDLLSKEIIRTLPCNHRFHVKCIDKWLQSHNTCPMCRAPVIDDYFMPAPKQNQNNGVLSLLRNERVVNPTINNHIREDRISSGELELITNSEGNPQTTYRFVVNYMRSD